MALMFTPAEAGLMKSVQPAPSRPGLGTITLAKFVLRGGLSGGLLAGVYALTLQGLCTWSHVKQAGSSRSTAGAEAEASVADSAASSCYPLLYDGANMEAVEPHTWGGWATQNAVILTMARDTLAWLFVFWTCVLSALIMHSTRGLRSFNPLRNRAWVLATLVVLGLQSAYFAISSDAFMSATTTATTGTVVMTTAQTTQSSPSLPVPDLAALPPVVLAVGFTWPVVWILLVEVQKHRAHKLAIRAQKRAELEFGTKLGMYSPV
eukprot:UC1_evm1s682